MHENNRNYNSYRFSYKFAFIFFLSFLTNQKQESGFQQVSGLVMRNISVFWLLRVALYFKAMPNSIDFYKGIFLHVIPVRVKVPCCIIACLAASRFGQKSPENTTDITVTKAEQTSKNAPSGKSCPVYKISLLKHFTSSNIQPFSPMHSYTHTQCECSS